jgi:hypothetical protein
METQHEYETEPVLAIFRSSENAHAGVEALHSMGIAAHATARQACMPGRYQAEDLSLREEGDGLWKGAALGAPAGALFGIALAVSVPSPGAGVVVGLAVAGAAGCGILGGLVGAIARARFDDDEAEFVEVAEEDGSELVIAFSRRPRRVREVLRQAGATEFLDSTTPEAAEVLRNCGARPGPPVVHPTAPPEPTAEPQPAKVAAPSAD